MPTDGHITKFFQELPVYSEQPHIKKVLLQITKRLAKILLELLNLCNPINGEGEDVKLSQRLSVPTEDYEALSKGKSDQRTVKTLLAVIIHQQ